MNFYKKGFSGVEILIVVAVLGVILAIVIPQFSKTRELQILKNGVENTLSSINKAKVETLSSLNSSEYGVHFQSDKVIIFKGKVFSAGASENIVVDITSPTTISNVTLGGVSSTSGDMYFNRLSGAPNVSGTITLSSGTYSRIITISATGNTNVN
ncbi:type II secretion system protein [Candidatus Nomurabacteria bacterium]|nr:type II secretion system protein [Candidatus Nomurabacteria bacterium]